MFLNTRILAIFKGIRIEIFKIFSPKRCDKKQKSFIRILPEFQKLYTKKKSKNKDIQYYVKRQFSLSLIPCRFLLRHLRFSHSSHLPGTLFFIISSPGVFLFLPGSFFFRHPRALCLFFLSFSGTLSFLSVIPGLDPGIQINYMASLFIWIAGSSPAMTKKKNKNDRTSKHTLYHIPAGATRPLRHSAVNSPRACRAGHPHNKKSPDGDLLLLVVRSENWENKNQLTLIFFEPIVEMLASKGSGSNRSERYIFDDIVFSAIHITKNPLTGIFCY